MQRGRLIGVAINRAQSVIANRTQGRIRPNTVTPVFRVVGFFSPYSKSVIRTLFYTSQSFA